MTAWDLFSEILIDALRLDVIERDQIHYLKWFLTDENDTRVKLDKWDQFIKFFSPISINGSKSNGIFFPLFDSSYLNFEFAFLINFWIFNFLS